MFGLSEKFSFPLLLQIRDHFEFIVYNQVSIYKSNIYLLDQKLGVYKSRPFSNTYCISRYFQSIVCITITEQLKIFFSTKSETCVFNLIFYKTLLGYSLTLFLVSFVVMEYVFIRRRRKSLSTCSRGLSAGRPLYNNNIILHPSSLISDSATRKI